MISVDPLVERAGALRAFSRFYTTVIGVLQEGLLDTPHSLTEARVLFELARREEMDVADLRRELGLDPARPLVVAAVGGSGVGVHLLRRIAAGFEELRRDVPEAEPLLVCGPRIDPDEIEPVEGMRAVGYVHDLFRTLACCDLAVVQGGLTTTMELVANRRPMIYVPLREHFEQNHHNVHRLRRYGAPGPTPYETATPDALAAQMLERLGADVDYEHVETDGAERAAALIAPLLEERKGSSERSFDVART
jgi:predicted glycosyltransferase